MTNRFVQHITVEESTSIQWVEDVRLSNKAHHFDVIMKAPHKYMNLGETRLIITLCNEITFSNSSQKKQEGQEALNRSPEYTDQKSNI